MAGKEQQLPAEFGHRAEGKFKGSAWRSRFLRAPKVALEFSDRDDFVPLRELADVKLGLKTGADSFFFLEVNADESKDGDLLPRRGVEIVKGMGGWIGQIANADLVPAMLNPHQLYSRDGRAIRFPKKSKHYYLSPREGKLRYGLAEYVRVGELNGIHQGKLVESNSLDGVWYRQARTLVSSRWVLPYNSAYDYGAWSNPDGFVLNGRFVGVDPIEQAQSETVGALLNSTFAALARLTEGVATGVEGAFDVGPPAARQITLPDPRRFSEAGIELVQTAFAAFADSNSMPSAPKRDGAVSRERQGLDTAILMALGNTEGQAAAILDRVYTSYGRWRGNVEDVETQMRANRRQMSATGQSRNQSPIDVAAKRVWEEIEHLLPLIPSSFLVQDETLEVVNVPKSAVLHETRPLFDEGVVQTKNKYINLKSFERVRYVAMLRTIGIAGNVEIPMQTKRAEAIVSLFDEHESKFTSIARENASKYVSGDEAIHVVVEKVRKHWHTACRKAALKKSSPPEDAKKLN